MKTKKGFTLIELLVVVLIIGILAAIAVPQYQKAVMKANLHKGVSLVESLYQAEQAYYLAHGDFTPNFQDLDISVPNLDSCEQGGDAATTLYTCDFGKIVINYGFTNIQYIEPSGQITYAHSFKEHPYFQKDKRFCFAKANNDTADSICKAMGGVKVEDMTGSWNYYQLD